MPSKTPLRSLSQRIEALKERAAALAYVSNGHDGPSDKAKMRLARFLQSEFLPAVAQVEGELVEAPHLEEWAEAVERHRFVALIAFRGSAKSTFCKAVVAHALKEHRRGAYDCVLYSSKLDLARWHLRRLKLYLRELAERWGWRDATQGEAILRYERPGAVFTCEPEGLDAASRGRRADLLVIDDPIDPKKATSMAEVERALEGLQRRILPLLKTDEARVLIAATPIVEGDIVDWVRKNLEFHTIELPALRNGLPTWPEKFSSEELARLQRLVGEKAFRAEYLLEVGAVFDSYLNPEVLEECIARDLWEHGPKSGLVSKGLVLG